MCQAGLLLSATASFATTTPPVGSILNYNTRGSYICLLLAFGLTLGGLIVGSTMLFVMSKCTASWFREVHGQCSIENDHRLTHNIADAHGIPLTYLLHAGVDCVSVYLHWCRNFCRGNWYNISLRFWNFTINALVLRTSCSCVELPRSSRSHRLHVRAAGSSLLDFCFCVDSVSSTEIPNLLWPIYLRRLERAPSERWMRCMRPSVSAQYTGPPYYTIKRT